MRRLLTFFVTATSVVIATVHVSHVRAAVGFTLGNLVVYRVGDGSASLNGNATAVFLDEYTPAGGLVQSIPMPTTVNGSNRRLTASGSATTEGFLTRSTDGRYIVLPGYDAALGTTGITTSSSATVNRVIGRVDSSAAIDTTTATTANSGGNPRGVASDDGNRFWIVGSNVGVQLATLGASSVTTISATQVNLREANIFGGQLYATTGAGAAFRVGAVGGGLPTTAGQTTTSLPGLPTGAGSSNGVFFADLSAAVPGLDTLYIADDSANQLQKYSLVSGAWTANGTVAAGTARGLTGIVDGTTVTLFGTTGGTLFKFLDATGYNASLTGAISTLASAATNTAIRGVSLTPSNSTPPQPTNPSGMGSANPSSVQAGTSTTLAVTVTPGANPPSTGLAVIADLTPIGGSATQAFTGGANNTFTFTATVPAATPTGANTITATITDTNTPPRSGSATISLTVTAPSTVPTGTGSALPSSLRGGTTTLLTVIVTPGANPTSTGLTVVGNLTAIGGSAAQSFTGAGNTFTYSALVPNETTFGLKSLPITIADSLQRTSSTTIQVSVKPPSSPSMKISQVYGGGGNSGATYTNDFIELFNIGSAPVDITGWSVQYSSSGATGVGAWSGGQGGNLTSLCPAGPCVIEPGHYFLVQESAGSGGTTALPAPDATGTILMSGTAAKIAIVAGTDPLSGPAGSVCPVSDDIVDFVGYGGANCAEATPTGGLSNTTAALRRGNGCIDTNNNSNDFVTVGPIPRNSGAPPNVCGGNPSRPSGTGIATPDSIEPAAETLLTVVVAPATTPPSSGLGVTIDLTRIGGSASQVMFDDGTHGDLTRGDNVFSFLALMPPSLMTGAKYFVATITDAQTRTATAPITVTIVSPTCGVERWSVKVGTDSTVGQVVLTPVTSLGPNLPATIENLGRVIPPDESELSPPLGAFAAARSSPIETTVFTVDATLTFYKKEADVDYHMVLDDGDGHTLISEIPSPACIITDGSPRVLVPSPLAEGIAKARAKFDSHLSAAGFFQNAGIPVRVTGVGFFDFEHGQTGVAPNAIELHPVLDISFRGNTSTALMSTENPSVYGDTMTLTATVTGGDGTTIPSGNVVFFDAGNSLTAVLNSSGQATYTTNRLTAGTHSITASYEGDDTSVPSISTVFQQVVAKADQTIDFPAIDGKAYGDADFEISAGASSGLPVTLSIVSGPATLSNSVIHITGIGTVTVRASQSGDDNYNAAPDVVRTFQIIDAAPPVISSVTPSQTSIWPPNKRMVAVSFAVNATDNVDPAPPCEVTGIASNEGTGADWEIAGPLTVTLRADRAGNGSGRVYVITVRCADASGNASTATATVAVPHDQGK